MSRLIARCCDPAPKLRLYALACVRQLIMIQNKYNGKKLNFGLVAIFFICFYSGMRQPDVDSALEELDEAKSNLSSEDPQVMYEAMKQVAKVCFKNH